MLNTKTKALICGFIFSVLFSFIDFSSKCEGINNKVFRLHIIANSDSQDDQELKLKVRDRILKDFGFEMQDVENIILAENIASKNISYIRDLAQDEVNSNGYNYKVEAEIINMYFNTREYGDIALPAGNYDALRISIGEGRGRNWWCVMFPPLCLPVANSELEMEDVLDSDELEIVSNSNSYRIEFKLIEIFTSIKEFIKNNIYNPLYNFFTSSENLEYDVDFKVGEIVYDTLNNSRN